MATMRLRCVHSCMVLTVVGLLLVYSAFLTSPSYFESSGIDGSDTSGSGIQNSNTNTNASTARLSSKNNGIAIGSSGLGSVASLVLSDPQSQSSSIPSQPQKASSGSVALVGQEHGVGSGKEVVGVGGRLPPSQGLGSQLKGGVIGGKEVSPPTLTHQASNDLAALKKKLLSSKSVPAYLKNAVWTKQIYEPGFSYSNAQVCPNDGQDIRLIILITSAPGHFSARDAIRMTWGHYSQRLDVSMAFIIGKTENETILDGLEMEKHLYDDLIVANFEDSYDNLTLKTMSTLEWIDTYCNQSEFVLKTDDDMFINVPNLLNFIDKIEEEDRKQPKLYGRLARKWKPVRNKKSKYYISFQQFKKTVYPDFTTGPAYLFRTRIARPLFDKGMEKTYLKLEDVYTTGILAQELKIKRMNIGDFANKKVNFHKTGFCALSKLISMHMVAYHEQFELWKKILDGRTKCKIIYNSSNNKNKTKETAVVANAGSMNVGTGTVTGTGSVSLSNSRIASTNPNAAATADAPKRK